METIGIAIIVLIVAWKLGVLKIAKETIEESTEMAAREIRVQAREHKNAVIDRTAKLKAVDAKTVAKAKANIQIIDSFDL